MSTARKNTIRKEIVKYFSKGNRSAVEDISPSDYLGLCMLLRLRYLSLSSVFLGQCSAISLPHVHSIAIGWTWGKHGVDCPPNFC